MKQKRETNGQPSPKVELEEYPDCIQLFQLISTAPSPSPSHPPTDDFPQPNVTEPETPLDPYQQQQQQQQQEIPEQEQQQPGPENPIPYELIYGGLDGLKSELDQYVGGVVDQNNNNSNLDTVSEISLMDELTANTGGSELIQNQQQQMYHQSAAVMIGNEDYYGGYYQQLPQNDGNFVIDGGNEMIGVVTPKQEMISSMYYDDVPYPHDDHGSNQSSTNDNSSQDGFGAAGATDGGAAGRLSMKAASVETSPENIRCPTSAVDMSSSSSYAVDQSIMYYSPWDESLIDFPSSSTTTTAATTANAPPSIEIKPATVFSGVISPSKCTVISQGSNVAALQTMEADRVIQQSIDALLFNQQQPQQPHEADGQKILVWSQFESPAVTTSVAAEGGHNGIFNNNNNNKNDRNYHNSSHNSSNGSSHDSGFSDERTGKSISTVIHGAEDGADRGADGVGADSLAYFYEDESAIEEYSDGEGGDASDDDDGAIDIVTRKPLKKKNKNKKKNKRGRKPKTDSGKTKSERKQKHPGVENNRETKVSKAKRPRKDLKPAELSVSKPRAVVQQQDKTLLVMDETGEDVTMMDETACSGGQPSRKSLGKALRPEFEVNCNPDQLRMEELANVHGYSYVQVQRWFQARRSQYKIRTRRESMLPPATLAMLEEEFKWDPWLESNRVVQLAKKLDLARDQVTGWFARKRKNLIKIGVSVPPRPKQIGGKRGAVSRTGSLTKEQRLIMEIEFQNNPWPYNDEINRIANDVELDRQQVYFWFKNKRRGQSSLHLGSVPVNEHVIAFRHTRRPITGAQLAVLHDEWMKCQKPTPERVEELSQQLLLTEKKIFNWFRGRRCRDRKRMCARLGLTRVPRNLKIAREAASSKSPSFEPLKKEEDGEDEEEPDEDDDDEEYVSEDDEEEEEEEDFDEMENQNKTEGDNNQQGVSMDAFNSKENKKAVSTDSRKTQIGCLKLVLKKDKEHKGAYKLVK